MINLETRAHSVEAIRRLARRRLPRTIFDFVDGGAEDERSRSWNETDLGSIELFPQPLNGTSTRDMSVELFGHRLDIPILVAPTGLSGLVWPKGEIAAANATVAAGSIYIASHASTVTIEDLANQEPGLKWFQLLMYRDRDLVRSFAERARQAGYKGLVLTVDNQVLGQRERDLENGFTLPPRLALRDAFSILRHPAWFLSMLGAPRPTMVNYGRQENIVSLSRYLAELLDPTMSWRDVDWLRSIWSGPLLLKGVLHAEEARLAVEHGIDGIIVSNHGGRQLDGAVSSVRALSSIVDQIGGRVPVLLDGGIQRGSDVVKAIALGATACLIGRPHLWGLATNGAAGVAKVLDILRADIDRTLALGGWDGLGALGRHILSSRSPGWQIKGQHGDRIDPSDERLFSSEQAVPQLPAPAEENRSFGLWRGE